MTTKGKLAFLLNPNAANCKQRDLRQMASKLLWGYDVEFLVPESPDETEQVCARLNPNQYLATVVAGGDGSISAALPGLAKSQVPLYPLPYGTANDLATELGITRSFAQLQVLVDNSSIKKIDLLSVNGLLFATVGGSGMGAELLTEFNERRIASRMYTRFAKLWGPRIYTLLSAKTVLMHKDSLRVLRIKSKEFAGTVETTLFLACNQSNLGRHISVAPEAMNDDGLFDVLVLTRNARLNSLKALNALRQGDDPDDCVRFQTTRVEVEDANHLPIRFFGDGDILCENQTIVIEMKKRALPVFVHDSRYDRLLT